MEEFVISNYCYCEGIEGADRAFMKNVGTEFPSVDDIETGARQRLLSLTESRGLGWDDAGFHLKYRITDPEDLFALFQEKGGSGLERAVEQGYVFSMLPLNAVLPEEVLTNFVPGCDYFDEHPSVNPEDPYGLFTGEARITGRHGRYLASRKFRHSALMPITSFCPVGCASCYRGYYTRETRENGSLSIGKGTIHEQAAELVEWLNMHPEVYDVIITGGEPLMVGNVVLKEIFDNFRGAEHLNIARICTGAIFQGMPFSIDDELLNMLGEFSYETGKRVTFQAHLSNHWQITPEALQAVRRIKKMGFGIYSQVPIKEGVNFFRENLDKTMYYLTELGRRQAVAGVEPYKLIMDIHPRTQKGCVPLELMLKVWSRVGESHDYPELERPKTLSILCPEGNIILSGYTLANMRKEVDRGKGMVIYRIPAVYQLSAGEPRMERMFTYGEPLMPGYNDDSGSLDMIRRFL